MVELGEDLYGPRGNDMGRVLGVIHRQVFSGHYWTCEGSGVPIAEAKD